MERITKVTPLPGFKLHVVFSDGTEGEVEFRDRLSGPVFEPLHDPARFAEVYLDEFGAPAWPNGADWAPDALYAEVRAQNLRSDRK